MTQLPTSSEQSLRIEGLDVARALAICGMTLVHLGMVLSGNVADDAGGWFLNRLAGRPAMIFMMLAGIGVSLRARKAQDEISLSTLKSSLRKRGVFFFVFGYAFLIVWSGDILRTYGLSFLLASLLITRRDRVLWSAAALASIGLVGMLFVIDFETNWDFTTFEYDNLWTSSGTLMHLFYNGTRSIFPWAGVMMIGMIVGRRDLRAPRVRWNLFTIGLTIWIATESISHQLIDRALSRSEPVDRETIVAIFGTDSMPSMPLFLLSSSGLSLSIVVACIYLAEYTSRKLWGSLADMGRLSFSWYVSHIAFVYAAGWLAGSSTKPVAHAYAATTACCLLMLAISHLYRRRRQYGPLEWLARRVSR